MHRARWSTTVMNAVESSKLVKVYSTRKRRTTALRGIDLSVPAGMLFSFLGRNGAGKTTFVKIASTLLMPTSGDISVLGHDVIGRPNDARELIAVVPQGIRPYWHLTPREHAYHYLRFRGSTREEAKSRTEWIIDAMGMKEYADTPALQLSGGLKQRTMVAMILASTAPVLFLDEPTIGMDPMARRQVWNVIEKIRSSGTTIFLTTHYLDEAERLSEELAVINNGEILYNGDVAGMKARVGADYRAILNRSAPIDLLENYGRVVEDGARLLVLADRGNVMALAEAASKKGLEISVGPVTLEEAFILLAGGGDGDER